MQLTMAKQEAVIECQKGELENLNESLSKKATKLADKNHENDKIREEMSALQKSFEASENVVRHFTYGDGGIASINSLLLRLFSRVTVCS